MATGKKTLSFAFPMTTALVADAVVTNLSQISLFLPEGSKTFTSVWVEVGFQDVVTATGGTITEHRVGLRLGAAGYTTVTELDDIVNTGENVAGLTGPWDFTSHFNTNWSGSSMTCDLQVYWDQNTGTTLGMANVTAILHVSYTYDDTSATQAKTIRIPLESLTGGLPTAANSNFGTNQIPQLTGTGGMLPEAGVTIRDYFFVIEGNEANSTGATDFSLSANIDGGAATTFQLQEAALATDRFCRWIYKPTAPDPTAAHQFQLWSSLASRCNHIAVDLYVTYEFTLAGTTRTVAQQLLALEIATPMGSTTAGDASRIQRTIDIQDAGTITMRQSALRINWNCNGGVTSVNIKGGAQASRAYSPAGSVVAGMYSLQHRIDSGSAQGAALTLARGRNTLTIDAFATGGIVATNVNGYILVTYECDLAAGGPSQNTHTVMEAKYGWDAAANFNNRLAGTSFQIPETNYYITGSGFYMLAMVNQLAGTISVDCENQSGEGKGGGYTDIYTDAYMMDAEIAAMTVYMRSRDVYKRFPADADSNRLNIETARDLRIFGTANFAKGLVQFVTYHTFEFTAAGTFTGNNASLPTELALLRVVPAPDPDEVMQKQTLSAGVSSFSFTVNDNTEDYYVSGYQDGTHVGRSPVAKAV